MPTLMKPRPGKKRGITGDWAMQLAVVAGGFVFAAMFLDFWSMVIAFACSYIVQLCWPLLQQVLRPEASCLDQLDEGPTEKLNSSPKARKTVSSPKRLERKPRSQSREAAAAQECMTIPKNGRTASHSMDFAMPPQEPSPALEQQPAVEILKASEPESNIAVDTPQDRDVSGVVAHAIHAEQKQEILEEDGEDDDDWTTYLERFLDSNDSPNDGNCTPRSVCKEPAQSQTPPSPQLPSTPSETELMDNLKKGDASPQSPSSPTSTRTPLERELMKVTKKVREVERLEKRLASGESLEPNQHQKLARGAEMKKWMSKLALQAAVLEQLKHAEQKQALLFDSPPGLEEDDSSRAADALMVAPPGLEFSEMPSCSPPTPPPGLDSPKAPIDLALHELLIEKHENIGQESDAPALIHSELLTEPPGLTAATPSQSPLVQSLPDFGLADFENQLALAHMTSMMMAHQMVASSSPFGMFPDVDLGLQADPQQPLPLDMQFNIPLDDSWQHTPMDYGAWVAPELWNQHCFQQGPVDVC